MKDSVVNDDVHSRHMDAVHNMMYRAAKTISQLCPGLGGGTVGEHVRAGRLPAGGKSENMPQRGLVNVPACVPLGSG